MQIHILIEFIIQVGLVDRDCLGSSKLGFNLEPDQTNDFQNFVFTASLLDAECSRDSRKNKPESLLVVPLRHYMGFTHFGVVDGWNKLQNTTTHHCVYSVVMVVSPWLSVIWLCCSNTLLKMRVTSEKKA